MLARWCGGRGIRTLDTRKRMAVFKTAAFNHSAIPPYICQVATRSLLLECRQIIPDKRNNSNTWYDARMRYLGIDYGTKRVGIALSDETGKVAFPHEVLPNNAHLLASLEECIKEHAVEAIVIGHSKNTTGENNPIHAAVTELMNDLTLATGLPIALEPEKYTTQEAILWQGKNDKTDASAAAIILNSYLSRERK